MIFQKTLMIFAVIAVNMFFIADANASKREALIIANSKYEWQQPLKNPLNDAQLIKKALEKLGFRTVVKIDVDRRSMNRAIKEFKRRLSKNHANVGVFYYAGHGVQNSEGENFLVPLKTQIKTLDDVDTEGYPAKSLMKDIRKSNVDVSMIFLDACRNQPFPPTVQGKTRGGYRGLAKMDIGIKNTLLMYSTAEGALAQDGEGNNSPFAIAVNEALQKQGSRLQDIPIEVTYKVSKLTDGAQIPFHALQSYSTDLVIHSIDNNNESIAWEATRDCNTLACYQQYLRDYPNGKNHDLAVIVIEKLKKEKQENNIGSTIPATQLPMIDYDHIANAAFVGKKLSSKQISLLLNHADNPKAQAILSILYAHGNGVEKDGNKAFELAQQSAESGEVLGMVRLSYFYRKGKETAKDSEKSFYWINKAVEFKNKHAYRNMGHYHYGLENPDYDKAKFWYEKAAALDDANAKVNLGRMYRDGEGVQQDYNKAFQLFKQSVEQGSFSGEFYLAYAYLEGQGVTKDSGTAIALFKKAAEKGDSVAQNNIGGIYQKGKGVQRDYIKALYWYKKAAENNLGQAMRSVGIFYRDGLGVKQDYSQAKNWLEKAIKAGDSDSLAQMGYLYEKGYGVEQDYQKAMSYYKKAANKDVGWAMRNIGIFYEHGKGVKQDYSQAKNWLEKATKAGDSNALAQMAYLYEKGYGVEQDYQEAMHWYKKAANKGVGWAMRSIGHMYENGLGVKKSKKSAIQWYQKIADQDKYARQRLEALRKIK